MAHLSARELAKITPALQSAVDSRALSGAVTLVWHYGTIAHVAVVGSRDIERALPMERDTIFRIASMTKPVTSVAALILMEDGKVRLEDPITKWAPEFSRMSVLREPNGPLNETYPAERDITIEDLMTHRAGFAYDFTAAEPLRSAYRTVLGNMFDPAQDPDAWTARLGTLPLSYSPGDRFHYSHATDVLGIVLARIARQPFRELLRQRIFAPLGMADTDFYVPWGKQERIATSYRYDHATGSAQAIPLAVAKEPPVFASGGGGLFSTVGDYLTFARMLLGKGEVDGIRLLRPETIELMTRNQLSKRQLEIASSGLPLGGGFGFGLGVSILLDPEKHSWMNVGSKGAFGWPGAFGTWWQADPAENLVMLYMVQDLLMPVQSGDQRLPVQRALAAFQEITYRALGH